MNPKQHKWKVSRAVIKQVSDISNNMYQKYIQCQGKKILSFKYIIIFYLNFQAKNY